MENGLKIVGQGDIAATSSSRRFVLGWLTLVCILFWPSQGSAQNANGAGAVEATRGEAFGVLGPRHRSLQRPDEVFVGEQVGTGAESRLAMRLGRNTVVKLGENAKLTIDRFLVSAGGELTLESGGLLFDRPAGSAPAPLQIRSPFGLIAVRGTQFFAGPSKGVFGVFVARGRVAVSAAGQTVTLRAGEGTDIAFPGAAPTPPTAWGRPRIQAALGSVR